MGNLTRDCPHCHTSNISFRSYGEVIRTNTKIYVTALHCEGCYGGYFIEVDTRVSPTAHGHKGDIEAAGTYSIMKEYPEPTERVAPAHIPDKIERFFNQATHSLDVGNLDAASMMARKVLEVAVKTLDPETNGSLYKRIEVLAESGLITEDIKEWAHIVREDGNEAAHEEDPVTPEFAEELIAFAEMFLMYTFTMPGMVAAKRHVLVSDSA